MSAVLRWCCARCGSERDEYLYGLCESCFDKMRDKFDAAMDLSYSAQAEICAEYGVSDIREAVVRKKYGRPSETVSYRCNRCGCSIGTSEAKAAWRYEDVHNCRSCRDSIEKDCKQSEARDRTRFDRL